MVHSDVDVDFAVYHRFQSQNIYLKNPLSQENITGGDPVLIELSSDLKSFGGKFDVIVR